MTKIRWTYLIAAISLFILMLALGSYPGNAQALTEKINDKIGNRTLSFKSDAHLFST